MSVPTLGNTPTGGAGNTPDELKTPGLVYMGNAVKRGEPPVIMFYRTVSFGQAFAPDAKKIDPTTGQPGLVHPVTVDVFFPNGPLAGRVYRSVGFIGKGMTPPIRQTALGSINVGQLHTADGTGNPYPQINALDPDAMKWAEAIHIDAGGNVFAKYDPAGEAAAVPALPQAQQQQPPADRFAGMPMPGQGAPAPQQQPQYASQQPQQPQQQQPAAGLPAGFPGAGGPPPGFPGAAPVQQPATNGQPQPVVQQPPAGVPNLGGPPPGMPGAGPMMPAGIGEPPY
jgi:hypothetical protein